MGDNTRGDDYDPYEHREDSEHHTNYFETFLNMVKGSLGTGILAMPYAFKSCGTFVGCISCVIIGILAVIGLRVLVISQYLICKKMKVPSILYTDALKAAMENGPECTKKWSILARPLVIVFTMINQYGLCCVYILFVSTTLKQVCDVYIGEFSLNYYILGLLVPFILVNSIPNLKAIAKLSFVALILSFLVYFSVVYYIFRDHIPLITERSMFGSLLGFPLYVGTYLFSMEAPALVIIIAGKMEKPAVFTKYYGELNMAYVICIFLYTAIGLLGYWKYGDEIMPAIILNFSKEEILANVVKVMYSVAILFTYVLHCYVSVEMIWHELVAKHVEGTKHTILYIYLIRFLSVIITVLLALAIPFLELVISLVGSFSLPFLGFIFPAVMDFCIKYPENKTNNKSGICLDILLIILGLLAFCVGSGCAVYEIILATRKKYQL